MLPRIGSALAQFIAPINSSNTQGQKSVGKKTRSNLETPYEKKEEGPKHQSEAQAQQKQSSTSSSLQSLPTKPESNSSQSLANTFLQIFNLFQIKNSILLHWLGVEAYGRSTQSQKKGAKFKKGTMLDEKIE